MIFIVILMFRFVFLMNGFEKYLQIDENTPIDVLLNHIKMLDSFQNNIIVFIIHITIASTEKN